MNRNIFKYQTFLAHRIGSSNIRPAATSASSFIRYKSTKQSSYGRNTSAVSSDDGYDDQIHPTMQQSLHQQPPRMQELRRQLSQPSAPGLDDFVLESINLGLKPKQPTSIFEFEEIYAETRKPVLEATTIPPQSYKSKEFFDVEQRKVLGESWQVVGYKSDLRRHGDTVMTTAAGQPIFLTMGKDKVIRGFYNACRHRGAQLVIENGRYPIISCPYHRWGYSLDGKLLATPMFKGDGVSEEAGADFGLEKEPSEEVKKAFSTEEVKNFNKKDYGLLPIRVDTWGPYVYANASGNAPPLDEYLGDLPKTLAEYPLDQLVSHSSSKIEVKANWKLLAENFMEYYHLPAVHPELCNVSTVDDHQRAQGHGSYIGFVTYPLANGGTALDPKVLPPMKGLTGINKDTAWFHHHFPNAFYFLLPHGLFSVVLEPKGPDVTIEHANLLIHPDVLDAPDAENKLKEMWDFYDLTNNQDLSICERVQIGIGAEAYKGGRMTFRFEETIHRFQNMIIDYMTGKPKIPDGDETYPFAFMKTTT